MGIWNKLFGKKQVSKPEKSPYYPETEGPLDIAFAERFGNKGTIY